MTGAEDLTQSLGRELFTLAQNETQAVINHSLFQIDTLPKNDKYIPHNTMLIKNGRRAGG